MAVAVARHFLENYFSINSSSSPLALRSLTPYLLAHAISLFFCTGWKKSCEAESKNGRQGVQRRAAGIFTERHGRGYPTNDLLAIPGNVAIQ